MSKTFTRFKSWYGHRPTSDLIWISFECKETHDYLIMSFVSLHVHFSNIIQLFNLSNPLDFFFFLG